MFSEMSASAMARILALFVAAVAGANVARTGTPAEGTGLDLTDALSAVDSAVAYDESSNAESEKAQAPPSPDVIDLSSEVSDLQAKLKTMKKMQLLQTAETKAATAGLEEKLVIAQEKAAETEGELSAAEAHVSVLDQQLAEEMKRRKIAEEKLLSEEKLALSFLQASERSQLPADFLDAIQKKLAEVEGKMAVEQKTQSESKVLLVKKSAMIMSKEGQLHRMEEQNKEMVKAAAQKDALLKDEQAKVLAKAEQPVVALSKESDREAKRHSSQAAEAQALAKKLGAVRMELEKLHNEKEELQMKLGAKQEVLDKMKAEVAQHKRTVAKLNTRKYNLNLTLSDMDEKEAATMRRAHAEHARLEGYQAELDEARQTAESKKMEIETQAQEMQNQSNAEKKLQDDQVEQTKALSRQIEQSDSELITVRDEVIKTKERIYQQQSQAIVAQQQITQEKLALEKEQAEEKARQDQLTAKLEGWKGEIVDVQAEYKEVAKKAGAAKAMLESEQEKRKEQEEKAEEDMKAVKEEEKQKVKEDADYVKEQKEKVEFEARDTKTRFTDQVDRMRQKYAKEEKEKGRWAKSQAEAQRGELQEKVDMIEKQLDREKQKAVDQVAVASSKEKALQGLFAESKEEENRKVEGYHQRMLELEASLQQERKASTEQLKDAKRSVQKLQEDVLTSEQELKTKQKAIQDLQVEVKRQQPEADKAEQKEKDFEAKLPQKVSEQHEMEDKGMLILERNAKVQVESLKKAIADDQSLEMEQVTELQDQISRQTRSKDEFERLNDLQEAGLNVDPVDTSVVQTNSTRKAFLAVKK